MSTDRPATLAGGAGAGIGAGPGGNGQAAAFSLDDRASRQAPHITPSTYLQYLPTLYQGDEFLGRFLRICEDILAPIEQTIDGVADSLDPRLAPEPYLPWLASWTGADLDENWPVARQRELIARAAQLYRWRGTRRGLREHLRLYAGHTPLIVENFTGLRLGQDAALGLNTRLGDQRPQSIYVTVLAEQPAALDEKVLRRIVEADKPAHAGYVLEVQSVPSAPDAGALPRRALVPTDGSPG